MDSPLSRSDSTRSGFACQDLFLKPIILITTCSYHLARNEQCRKTWLARWKHLIDYKFVFGSYTALKEDEISFPVDDSYSGLPSKIQASHKWALEQGYDYILKTDCDIYLHVPRLLSSGFENFPYSGNHYYKESPYPFALGAAYWLDKNASEILCNEKAPYGIDGGDDMWVGRTMRDNAIPLHDEPRYYVGNTPNWNEVISVHSTDLKMNMFDIQEKCA